MDNKTTLLIFMVVLIAFVMLLTVLGLVFIIALRKRAPVVKIVMAPQTVETNPDEYDRQEEQDEQLQTEKAQSSGEQESLTRQVSESERLVTPEEEPEADDEDDDAQSFIVEGQERVRYDRSLYAKIAQLKKESKDWYGELKNELLSYEKMKSRMSWRRETFRVGRMSVARIVVRGKTLCLLLAVEPSGYSGTKYSVEDVSNTASLSDTPTLYRIKNARRLKYAKEMVQGIMRELKMYKDVRYEPKDFFLPYEGDMAFMQRGLVKRVVSSSTRMFKVEEIDAEAAATEENKPDVNSDDKE